MSAFYYLCSPMSGTTIIELLIKDDFSKDDLVRLLKAEGEDKLILFKKSADVKEQYIGKKVWLRGLIEFSNICGKDCMYCGIVSLRSDAYCFPISA